jgi:hypothetical protein
MIENDLTSFEFGRGKAFKVCEQAILMHIARLIGVEEFGQAFWRVWNDRDKVCTWSMRYTDECGEKRVFRLKLRNCVRESGDRITSSGNFLMNVIAWLFALCSDDERSLEETIKEMVKNKGTTFHYTSLRDGRRYEARLRYEGDDTAGKLQELCNQGFMEHLEMMFRRMKWQPKFKRIKEKGLDFLRFVGWDFLTRDGAIVFEDGEPITAPELKRMFKTKQWTNFVGTPAERAECTKVYAAVMAEPYAKVAPVWAFLSSMYADNITKANGVRVSDERMRDLHLAATGELPDGTSRMLGDIAFPEFESGESANWRDFCRTTAGDFTAEEWATMCGLTTLEMHGKDLASFVPRTWLK